MTLSNHVAWDDLMTTGFVDYIEGVSGLSGALPVGSRELLVQIFSATGGLALFDAELDDGEKTRLAQRLLGEAAAHVLSRMGLQPLPPGFVLEDRVGQLFAQEIQSIDRLPVNVASADMLAAMPVIGNLIAGRIVQERNNFGPFESIEDLINRVPGLGDAAASKLKEAVRFDHPADEWHYSLPAEHDVDSAFEAYLERTASTAPDARLLTALDRLATSIASEQHPASAQQRPRPLHADNATFPHSATSAVLSGSDYYHQVPTLLTSATASIDVAMFHIAFPETSHPTRALLDALVAAQVSGVSVRVLLDRDRPTDPYQSTLINTPARDFLIANGVASRFDDDATLLHSKYVVIDDQTVIVGSHNWSAGSFFHFDDVSLVIQSADYASDLTQRFENLWSAGGP